MFLLDNAPILFWWME